MSWFDSNKSGTWLSALVNFSVKSRAALPKPAGLMNDCNEGNNSSASIIQPFIVCSCRRALLGHFEIGAFHSDTDPRKSEQEILEIHWAEHIIYSILHTYCIYDMLFLRCSFWYCRVWIRNRLFSLFIVKFQKSITHPDTRFPPCFVFNKRRAPFLFI